jgi:hypothetical protein
MRKKNKILPGIFFVFILLAFFIYVFIAQPIFAIKKEGQNLVKKAEILKQTLKKNDIELLEKEFNAFDREYQNFRKEAKKLYWLSFISYGADFKNGVESGDYFLKAGKLMINSIKPYADLIGFKKGGASFVEQSAEDRLQTAIITVDKMLGNIDQISDYLHQGQILVDKINPDRYPKKIGNLEVRTRLEKTKGEIDGFLSLFVNAKPILKKLPQIFGVDKEKTYLILFQNDKELRATGGFLTSYAIFKIKNGKITIERSEDIYDLDNSISSHPPAPREIKTYHIGVSTFNIRDSNLSPDFPTSIELFNSLYQKSGKKVNYDGIIAIDSQVLVDLLNVFGDTEVDGVVFSAKLDPRCDCPSAIYKLFDIVDRPTPYLRENRKGILGRLMYTLFYKALGFSPSKYWGTLIQEMVKNLEQKHILVYFVDPSLQQSIEALNYGGRIRSYEGDYLHINNVNFAGAKSNMFVNEEMETKTEFKNNKILRTVTVTYKNPYPHSDCNLERGGLCLNATLRNWVRLYLPKDAYLTSFRGSEKKVITYQDLGKKVVEGFLQVPTQGMAKIVVQYELPKEQSSYRLLIQKQPGTKEQKLKVIIGGKTVYDGVLDKDKEF